MSKEIAQTVGGKKIAWLIAIVAALAVVATLVTQWKSSEAAEMPQVTLNSYDAADTAILSTGDSKPSGNEIAVSLSEPAGLTANDDLKQGGMASFAHLVGMTANSDMSGSYDGNVNAAVSITDKIANPGNPWNAKYIGDSDYVKSNPLDTYFSSLRGSSITCHVICGASDAETKTNTVNVLNASSFGTVATVIWTRGSKVTDGYVALVEAFNGETAELGANSSFIVAIEDIPALPFILRGSSFSDRTGSGEVIASSALAPGSDELSSGIVPNSSLDGTGPSNTRPVASSQGGSRASEGGATAMWLYIALGLGAVAFFIGGTAVARRSQ